MYSWYHDAATCYALLDDISSFNGIFPEAEFRSARWFTRGWCFQELIAPSRIEFYTSDWREIGTKWSLHNKIEEITGIPRDILLEKTSLESCNTAQKMSWASKRRTTRQEDMAYCLMGIFNINMPLLYGEGGKAFHRLQEEILRQTEDYSLLLWDSENDGTQSVLASSPACFPSPGFFIWRWPESDPDSDTISYLDYRRVSCMPITHSISSKTDTSLTWVPPQMTPRGLRFHSLVERGPWPLLLVFTGCTYDEFYLCLELRKDNLSDLWGRGHRQSIALVSALYFRKFEFLEVYLNQNQGYLTLLRLTTSMARWINGHVLKL